MTVCAALAVLLTGLLTGLALIVAIGAQNAFVLRVGITSGPRVVLPMVLVCAISDAVLIVAGVVGIGAVIQAAPVALVVIRVIGAGFLIVYGVLAGVRAVRGNQAVDASAEAAVPAGAHAPAGGADVLGGAGGVGGAGVLGGVGGVGGAGGLRGVGGLGAARAGVADAARVAVQPVILTALALTWLNPHVYLDTVIFLGSVANQQGEVGRWWFAAGATVASFVWFFALGFGARLLRPVFAKPLSWRVLDAMIAVVMLVLGVKIAVGA